MMLQPQPAKSCQNVIGPNNRRTPDGRIISVPIRWFPLLREATHEQREQYEIGGGGVSLHWPEIDEDLSIAGLMAGVDWRAA